MMFDDPKVGDHVAQDSCLRDEPQKLKITKVTATQITVTGGIRYSRERGREVGAAGLRTWIEPWTEETERKIANNRTRSALAKRREHVLKRLDAATKLSRIPHPLYGERYGLVERPLDNRQLDELEALAMEIEGRVAALVAAWSANKESDGSK